MANRIEGNVYIIDSHQVAAPLRFDGKMNVGSIAFWGSNSTGIVQFSGSTTTNVVAKLQIGEAGGGTTSVFVNTTFDELYVPTITAGTAWIYLQ